MFRVPGSISSDMFTGVLYLEFLAYFVGFLYALEVYCRVEQ